MREVIIKGTWRESEKTKKYWDKKKLTMQEAEAIFAKKDWGRFALPKEERRAV